MELIFGIAIAVIAMAFVIRPLYLARLRGRSEIAPTPGELEALLNLRDTLYESIREVDLDRQLGHLSEEDHARHRREYVTQAADILRRIDDLDRNRLDRWIEREVAQLRGGLSEDLQTALPPREGGRGAK